MVTHHSWRLATVANTARAIARCLAPQTVRRMDTQRPFTAPLWSADPNIVIDRQLPATHTAQHRDQLRAIATELDHLAHRHPADRAVDRLLCSQEHFDDRANAYAAVITFHHLGLLDVPALRWPGWQAPETTAKRLLRTLEFACIAYVGQRSDAATVAVGALAAGASSGELQAIEATHLHRADRDDQIRIAVALPGTNRTVARTLVLADWATGAALRLAARRPRGSLLYGGRSTDPDKRTSCVLMSVGKTIGAAGLAHDPTVTPESIRNSGARQVLLAAPPGQGLQHASAALGIVDLDLVANRVGWCPTPYSGLDPAVPVI